MTPKDIKQSAVGDGNIQIGGDGVVKIGTNIQGVPPSEHAKALAQIEILKEKLAIAQAADREDPTEEEVLAAEEAMEAAEELKEMGAELDPWDYIALGQAAFWRGKTFLAEKYFREAKRVFRVNEDKKGEATSIRSLGNISMTRGDVRDAKSNYQESLEIMRQISDLSGQAMALNNLGGVARAVGNHESAIRLYNESLELWRESGVSGVESRVLRNIGNMSQMQGNLEEAEILYNDALEVARSTEDEDYVILREVDIIDSLTSLGVLIRETLGVEDSEPYFKEAMEIANDSVYRKGKIWLHINFGINARMVRNFDEAIRHTGKALKISQEAGDGSGEARSLVFLGAIHRESGNNTKARRCYTEALAINRAIGDRNDEALTLNNLGDIAKDLGELDKAERLYREHVRIFNELDIPLGDWYVEHGYTDPDADWNFPPPPPAASEEDES